SVSSAIFSVSRNKYSCWTASKFSIGCPEVSISKTSLAMVKFVVEKKREIPTDRDFPVHRSKPYLFFFFFFAPFFFEVIPGFTSNQVFYLRLHLRAAPCGPNAALPP